MATTARELGRNLMKHLTGRVSTTVDRAALLTLDVATSGTQQATKFITTDSNINQGVVKTSAVHIGVSGSEVEITSSGAEINQAFDLSSKGEVLTSTEALTVADNNKIFFLSAVAGFTTTLPALADVASGWRCRFITKTALTSNSYIITEKASADTDKVATNFIVELEVDDANNGPFNADHATITFVNGINVVGDWVEIETDGVIWYANGLTKLDGGITLA